MGIDTHIISDRSGADTIVAMSTPPGRGAIGIVRVSGPDAIRIGEAAFRPARGFPLGPAETHCLLYGHVVGGSDRVVIDEALLAVMRAPRTYTREDVVEIHCHGGLAAQREVLREVIRLGARPADPGEFTRRAFINGRIDLAQAEGVASIVAARSSGALRASVRQLEGGLSSKLRDARRRLVEALAQVEAMVDFADEDLETTDWSAVEGALRAAVNELRLLLQTAFLGRALEHGVRTAIVGRPNVGKSSLLNALLMRERSIVSEIPGTTRDTVEEIVEIGGIPLHLVDTAGMRSGGDRVEQMGVERSHRAMESADLVLAVFDLSKPWTAADSRLLARLDPTRSIVVGNKVDILDPFDPEVLVRRAATMRGDWTVCSVSATVGTGLEGLRSLILKSVAGDAGLHLEEPILANERQRNLVNEALERAEAALTGSEEGAGEELICEDLRSSVKALGLITGEDITSDLLEEIFSRFCIGK
jgi:tRNA modification GTPase